jgi:hypothetical protein
METVFVCLQSTAVAAAVGDSILLTGALSAVHLLGFTLVTGSALVGNLRLLGVILSDRAVLDVVRPTSRGVALGLLISVATGVLLFAPRAVAASVNRTFQIKMLLLASATAFHFSVHRVFSARPVVSRGMLRAVGSTGLLLWVSLAVAGCAFILLGE